MSQCCRGFRPCCMMRSKVSKSIAPLLAAPTLPITQLLIIFCQVASASSYSFYPSLRSSQRSSNFSSSSSTSYDYMASLTLFLAFSKCLTSPSVVIISSFAIASKASRRFQCDNCVWWSVPAITNCVQSTDPVLSLSMPRKAYYKFSSSSLLRSSVSRKPATVSGSLQLILPFIPWSNKLNFFAMLCN